jgi:pimeloyl-ACP methyl ester carboxylesterase
MRTGRSLVFSATLVLVLVPPAVSASAPGASRPAAAVAVDAVTFEVTNPLVSGETYAVKGFLYRPGNAPACSSSVFLLLHGTAGGAWGWDFPIRPEKYSVARALAAAGYPAVAIDELGYGSSDHPNGWTLTIPSYAAITAQIIDQLRAGSYQAVAPVPFMKVGLAGHSAGAEMAELTAGTSGNVDLLMVLGYEHFISQEVGQVFFAEEQARALQRDYVYFWGTRERVHRFHHNPDYIDPDVLAKVDELTTLTPSGLVLSIGNQPSGKVMGSIRVPVLLVLSEKDTIFPIEHATKELALFAGASDKTLQVVPYAGHSFQLEPNAPETNAGIVQWLHQHAASLPSC